jgi:hypothetical protein
LPQLIVINERVAPAESRAPFPEILVTVPLAGSTVKTVFPLAAAAMFPTSVVLTDVTEYVCAAKGSENKNAIVTAAAARILALVIPCPSQR